MYRSIALAFAAAAILATVALADKTTIVRHETVNATSVASEGMPANPNRNHCFVQNNDPTLTVYADFYQTATTESVTIIAGFWYAPKPCPINALSLLAASGNVEVLIIEGEGK